MNRIKSAAVSAKNFVVTHKTPIAIAATAVITTVVVRKACGGAFETAREFIEEKGLLEEFNATFEDVTN